jgi:hypothetical protein
MSGYASWDDDDETPENETPKGLRKQIEELARKLGEANATITGLQTVNRSRTLADGLKDLGIANFEKVAKLVPTDVADKPDSLKSWIEEFKDVFAIQTSAPEAPANKPEAGAQTNPDLPPEQVQAFQRMQTADSSAGTTIPDLESQHLAQLQAAATAADGSFDKYIAILRGEVPLP